MRREHGEQNSHCFALRAIMFILLLLWTFAIACCHFLISIALLQCYFVTRLG